MRLGFAVYIATRAQRQISCIQPAFWAFWAFCPALKTREREVRAASRT